jgi:hypothetical protein
VTLNGNAIACDHEGCDYFVTYSGPMRAVQFSPEPFARMYARKEGWTVTDKGDVCPRHSN